MSHQNTELALGDDIFRAVLAFVDSYDSDVSSTSSSSTVKSPSATNDMGSGQRARAQHSAYRTRAEIQDLKNMVVQLEGQIVELERERVDSNSVRQPDSVVWRAAAWRERQRRRLAEAENGRLQAMVHEQTQTARRLEKLLRECHEERRLAP